MLPLFFNYMSNVWALIAFSNVNWVGTVLPYNVANCGQYCQYFKI